MKISPLKDTDPWYHRVMGENTTQAETLRDVPVETTVDMDQVEILHHTAERNYRPYLHLRGTLAKVVPDVVLPYGITELPLSRGSGLPMDSFYEFDNEQLSDLVKKNYFSANFEVPAAMVGVPWDLPGTADFTIVAPEFNDEPPLVFMGIHNQSDLLLDEANSGHDLQVYFQDFTHPELSATHVSDHEVEEVRTRTDRVNPLFSDEVFAMETESEVVREAAKQDKIHDRHQESVPKSIFAKLLAEMDAQRLAEESAMTMAVNQPNVEAPEEVHVAEAVPLNDYVEDMYRSRISPGVEAALKAEMASEEPMTAAKVDEVIQRVEAELAEETERETKTYLTLDGEDDEELGIKPFDTGAEARNKAAQKSAATRAAAREAHFAQTEDEKSSDTEYDGLG